MRLAQGVAVWLAAGVAVAAPAASVPAQSAKPPDRAHPVIFAQIGGPTLTAGAEQVLAECERPATGETSCVARFVLEVEGVKVLDRVVDVPRGEPGIVLEPDIRRQRNAVLRKGGDVIHGHLRIYALDGELLDQHRRNDRIGVARPSFPMPGCVVPVGMRLQGGPVTVLWDGRRHVMTKEMPGWLEVINGPAKASFKLAGVIYTMAPHTRATLHCSLVFSVDRRRWFATLLLQSGAVRVSGKPRGRAQPATNVATPEASFGSRSRERVDFRVMRNAKRRISTMRVRIGRTTEATRIVGGVGASFPCTRGKSIRVSRRGVIR
jgi:hypothetical protein